ncbi:MAG: hypothetical protein AAGI46_14240 [Planctomycetota bacterium]
MTDGLPRSQKEAERLAQRRDFARGCLLALILEGAALLAAVGWVIAVAAGWLEAGRALGFAFAVFTGAAAVVAFVIVVMGNTRKQRAIRDATESEPTTSAER